MKNFYLDYFQYIVLSCTIVSYFLLLNVTKINTRKLNTLTETQLFALSMAFKQLKTMYEP